MKLYGGKPILNSINFEDGEEAAHHRLEMARRYGAAVIALTIDEAGMAKSAERKVAVAKRLHDFACVQHGLPASHLIIDRNSVGLGKSVSVRVDFGGRCIIKEKNKHNTTR